MLDLISLLGSNVRGGPGRTCLRQPDTSSGTSSSLLLERHSSLLVALPSLLPVLLHPERLPGGVMGGGSMSCRRNLSTWSRGAALFSTALAFQRRLETR